MPFYRPFAGLAVALLAGCAQVPFATTVQVMPGPGKSYAQFQNDQAQCGAQANYAAHGQVQAANNRAVGAAVLSTALGAGLGAAVGGGRGAGYGAAAGAATGVGIAAEMGANDQYAIQGIYDNAYGQCMYARGHRVDGMGVAVETSARPAGPDPALVSAVQVELARLGYLGGPPDGAAGPMTQSAIRNFEQNNGMRASGYPTQRLLAKLQSTTSGGGSMSSAAAGSSGGGGGGSSGWVAPGTGGAATTSAAPGGSSGWVTPGR